MNRNYQLELDNIIKNLDASCVPTLLIHSCCAPCSSYVLEYLSDYFKITVYYYNPNIYPADEFLFRMQEQKRFIEEFTANNPDKNPIDLIESDHLSERFYEAVRGLENEPEGGKRCEKCFRLRLGESAKLAAEKGFDYFTTTLSISPHKNAQLLNELGEEIGSKAGVKYLYSDFKKRGGFVRSAEISKEYNMYRQDYCGCVYSYNERKNS
ncbi:MAG: epoxyqueuosine reductase QueH [Lachnospiraceae bacterium]|nr:epoxyqueuosine reductase QueH [Lachnospiraceae bacterium]